MYNYICQLKDKEVKANKRIVTREGKTEIDRWIERYIDRQKGR